MDIASISSLNGLYKTTAGDKAVKQISHNNGNDFSAVFNSALNMVNETNTLQNNAEAEQIKFILGESDNTHDLAIAQQKANVALQYTVAVRNRFISAYQELMNMQM